MSIRLAIIGAGAMAREHLRAFADIPGVQLMGIHSRTRSKAEALAEEFRRAGPVHPLYVCESADDLYEKTRADLLIIAVPELAARAVSLASFEHPWAVLMEKPAGYNLADAQAILAAAQAKQRRVWVGLNRRFLSSTQSAYDDLLQNSSPRLIHVQDQQSLETAAAIGHPEQVVANWMFANSIHLIDYLRFFGRGRVVNVQTIWPWRGSETHTVLATIEFSSGDRGIYEGIWKGPGPWAVTISTPEKRWEMRPLEKAQFQNAGERRLVSVDVHDWDQRFKPGFRMQAEEVVSAVLGQPSQAPTLEEATEMMQLIDHIFQSKIEKAAQAA